MAFLSVVALLLAPLCGAMRIVRQDNDNVPLPQKFAKRFCLSEDTHLACSDHSSISIYSAFYNTRKDESCGLPPTPTAETKESCATNFTEQVVASCNGMNECILPTSMYPYCTTKPFRGHRIVWYCQPIVPDTDQEEEKDDEVQEEPNIVLADLPDHHTEDEGLPTVPPTTTQSTTQSTAQSTAPLAVRHSENFCTSMPLHLTCPTGSGLQLYSAFYNTRRRDTCVPHQSVCSGASSPLCDCGSNATNLVLDECKTGSSECTLQPEAHRFCAKRPFTFLRVVWYCVTGLQRSKEEIHHVVADGEE